MKRTLLCEKFIAFLIPFLPDISDGQAQGHEHYLNGGVGALSGALSPNGGSSSSGENHMMSCEDGDREAIDDDRQTEFGELVETGSSFQQR